MPKDEVRVAGRLVGVATGNASQTINILGPAETPGEYERVFRIQAPQLFVRPPALARQGFETVDELATFLKDEHAAVEEAPRKAPYLRR